jgi:hypothetical protein
MDYDLVVLRRDGVPTALEMRVPYGAGFDSYYHRYGKLRKPGAAVRC